ncbi:MAG: CheR family methyltransferase [Kofleriaceae bacterium]
MTPTLPEPALEAFLDSIYRVYHYDFRKYARASLRRRLLLAQTKLGCDSVDALVDRVLAEPTAFTTLLGYFTIQVSDLFRDPSYFLAFRQRIVPVLRTYPSRRLWVAGCSTGEEAYSLAIILREEGLLDRSLIYATDIYPESLRIAAAGIYELDRLQAFTESHRKSGATSSLSSHYTTGPRGGAVFDRGLRDRIVFADHSLATDHVFAEVHVVSCRNVLIYFTRELQDRALGVFRDALVRRGFLGVGPRETLAFSAVAGEFAPVPAADRWHQRVDHR